MYTVIVIRTASGIFFLNFTGITQNQYMHLFTEWILRY